MKGRKKIWTMCMVLVLALSVTGLCYYYYQANGAKTKSEGILIMESGLEQLCR